MDQIRTLKLHIPEKPLPPLKLIGTFREGDYVKVLSGKHKDKIARVRYLSSGLVFLTHKTSNFHVKESELKWISHSQT
jgi:transcription elongation factor